MHKGTNSQHLCKHHPQNAAEMEGKIRIQGKTNTLVIFKVLFVEDQKYVLFNSLDLVRLLGPDKMEELKEKDKLKK